MRLTEPDTATEWQPWEPSVGLIGLTVFQVADGNF